VERGPWPGSHLHVHEWNHLDSAKHRKLGIHCESCKVPGTTARRLAWSPFGNKRTVIRAGFGMYDDLQDALGYRTDQNAPFNPTYSLPSLPVSQLPISPAAPVRASAKLVAGGVQPDLKTPTLVSWSFRIQRELSANTALTAGYVGSHGYHEIIGADANEPFPVICPAAPVRQTIPATSRRLAGTPVPAERTMSRRRRERIPHWRTPGPISRR